MKIKINGNYYIIYLLLVLSCATDLPYFNVTETKDILTAEEHNDLGVVYEKQHKLDLAEKEYQKALKKKSNWAIPYYNLGNIYYKKQRYDLSEIYYKKAIEFDPVYTDCMNNLAFLLYEQSRYQEAKKYIDKAILIKKKKEYLDTRNKILQKL